MRTKEELIATAKKITDTTVSITLWPLAMLIAKVKKANRTIIRWAIRHRCKPAYLFVIFWFPSLSLTLLLWAIAAIPPQESTVVSATVMTILLVTKKLGVLALYFLEEGTRVKGLIKHYRREFSKER